MKKWNLLDVFLTVFILLTGVAFYFTIVNPVKFSHLIKREGVTRYAEAEILLSEDLAWLRDVMPVGEEQRNVYGRIDWQLLGFGEESLAGKKRTKMKVKLLVVEESSGIIRYGKYTLVKGSPLNLINDRYFVGGWLFDLKLLDEKAPL